MIARARPRPRPRLRKTSVLVVLGQEAVWTVRKKVGRNRGHSSSIYRSRLMLRSLAQHAEEDAGVGRNDIPASCTGAMCCETNALRMPAPPATPYTVCPRASNAKACCCLLRITYRPIPSVDAYEAPATGTVPSVILYAVGLSAAASCTVDSACGGLLCLPHTTLGLPGGLAVDEGSELRKVHRSGYVGVYILLPYPASFARLKRSLVAEPAQNNRSVVVFGSRLASICWYATTHA